MSAAHAPSPRLSPSRHLSALRRLSKLPRLAPSVETGVLSEFTPTAMKRGVTAYLIVLALGYALLGWRGWLQYMTELWVAYAVTFLLLLWLRSRFKQWVPTRPLIVVLVAGPLFGALLATPVALLPSAPEARTGAAVAGHVAVGFLFASTLALMQISFGLVLARQRRQADMRQRQILLEREMLATRLAMLQAQIEPHFLYNSLANVQVLTRSDPESADRMLSHLIDYLRAAVPAMRGGTSTLGRELALARAYLSIMQFRMGDRLQFSVDAPSELSAHELPPTVIGTLIENAIKHGLEPAARGGRIDVRAWAQNRKLHIDVADTGVGFTASAGSGVGLANARERLSLIYGTEAELDLSVSDQGGSNQGEPQGGVTARITVPLAEGFESTADPTDSATASVNHADRPAA